MERLKDRPQKPPLSNRRCLWGASALLCFVVLSTGWIIAVDTPDPDLEFVVGSGAYVRYEANAQEYYVLLKDEDLIGDFRPHGVSLASRNGALDEFLDAGAVSADRRFYQVKAVDIGTPEDQDVDGIDDVYELLSSGLLNPLDEADASQDPDGNGKTFLEEYRDGKSNAITSWSSSPAHLETGVAITRETIVYFNQPIANLHALSPETFYATYGGEKLRARIHVSPDFKKVTLFYEELLPANARVRVVLDGDFLRDRYGKPIDGDLDGTPGGQAEFEFDTLTVTALAGTAVCGRVFASEPEDAEHGFGEVNCPLANVKITVDGREDELFTFTDEMGNFRLEPAPVGRFFVHIDGRTSTTPAPEGGYFPFVGKSWEANAGIETNIGDVFLPLVVGTVLTEVSAEEETVIEVPDEYAEVFPDLEGVELRVPPDALFADDGTRGGMVGIAPVDPERLPGQLPPDLNLPLVITVQTDGATNFDRPVPVCFPNLPDPETGELLPPGAKTALWSFNHDTGRFEVVGPMTISEDGLFACTDPGVGILAPGWHGTSPGGPGGGGGPPPGPPPPCKKKKPEDPCDPAVQCCDQESEGAFGDPVHLASGEFVHEETDMVIKGRGMDFVWKRSYASQEGKLTPMGHNWDVNFNLRIFPEGRIIRLKHGRSNDDFLYELEPGVYDRAAMDLDLQKQPDESYTLTFGNQAKWDFHPCDGSAMDGRATAIRDRHGNTIQLEYDAQGRLIRIIDTLDRPVDVAYNADGFIASVTDFTGRQITYQYYQDGEIGGGFGDLKSVTSPAVTATPHGNDFPQGKTRSYTYTSGYEDERLNHNLVSIVDGRRNDPNDPTFDPDRPYLVNEYGTELDPVEASFDRVVRQTWGDPGDIIDFYYLALTPENPGEDEIYRVIVNDRNGNVTEHFFDIDLDKTRERVFTGRADPDTRTTADVNRPRNKLRPDDPDFFETRWEHNLDSLVTRVTYPNGNVEENTYEVDINPDVDSRFRGNLRMNIRLPGTHQPAGDQDMLVEEFEYANDFGCNSCGFNFVTRHTDPRGNVTVSDFDDKGNLIRRTHRLPSIVEEWTYNAFGQMTSHTLPDNGSGHRRVDAYTYHTEGSQRGYKKDRIVDQGGFELTTTYEYDALGRVVRESDPRRNDTLYTYNALDQVVQEFSKEVTVAQGAKVRYEKRTWFDANDNVVRVDTKNVDETGQQLAANPWFTTSYDHELLNHVVRTSQEVEPGHDIVTEFGYDAKRNQTLTRYGEATNGNQPTNTLTNVYDERDLLFREIRAEGDPDQSTNQHDYDSNGNRVVFQSGIEDTEKPRVNRLTYDGYNRMLTKTDPMGNVCTYSYDANGNLTGELCEGELLDVEGDTNNIRLAEKSWVYDGLDRRTQEIKVHFKHDDQGAEVVIGDGEATTSTVWSDNSQVVRTTNDNNHSTDYTYDTSNRLQMTTDAKGNTVTHGYDANSNRISVHEVDKSDLGNPDQEFTTTLEFDELDRLIATIDNIGNTNRSLYDSRANRTSTIDALGNRVEYRHDGLNRLLETDRFMTDTGDGNGNVIDHIVTRQYWDDSSRLVGQGDGEGNLTSYGYDPLSRKVTTVYADGTEIVCELDVHHNDVRCVDANGSVFVTTYDLLNRHVRKDISPGVGVSDQTTFCIYRYDGLSRLVSGDDDDSTIKLGYDSLDQQILDEQNGNRVTCAKDALGNDLVLTYPSGTVINATFDPLERKSAISIAGNLFATYSYVGSDRVEKIAYASGVNSDYTYNGIAGVPNAGGDFGVKGVARVRHWNPASSAIFDQRDYLWDRVGNKKQRTRSGEGEPRVQDFSYDSIYRLVQAADSRSDVFGPDVAYQYDRAGNRREVIGGVNPGTYHLNNSTPEPNDAVVNQYSMIPGATLSYDENGNRIEHASSTTELVVASVFDALNQLVSVSMDEQTLIFVYDILGRRVKKTVAGGAVTETIHVYLGRNTIADRLVGGTEKDYIKGHVGNANSIGVLSSGQANAIHCDSLRSQVAATSQLGTLIELVDYDVEGKPDYALGPHGDSGSPFLFAGARWEMEFGHYHLDHRYYQPLIGQFISRDPGGVWFDAGSLGNARAYTGSNPWSRIDPDGLSWCSLVCTAGSAAGKVCSLGGAAGRAICGVGGVLLCDFVCKTCSLPFNYPKGRRQEIKRDDCTKCGEKTGERVVVTEYLVECRNGREVTRKVWECVKECDGYKECRGWLRY